MPAAAATSVAAAGLRARVALRNRAMAPTRQPAALSCARRSLPWPFFSRKPSIAGPTPPARPRPS